MDYKINNSLQMDGDTLEDEIINDITIKDSFVNTTSNQNIGGIKTFTDGIKSILEPISDDDLTTKSYVDNAISGGGSGGNYLPLSGGIMTGDIDMNNNKLNGVGGIELKRRDGVTAGFINFDENEDEAKQILEIKNISGGNDDSISFLTQQTGQHTYSGIKERFVITGQEAMFHNLTKLTIDSGHLNLIGTNIDMGLRRINNLTLPFDENDAVNKKYVDSAIANIPSGGNGNYLPLSGGTMTGGINMANGEPIQFDNDNKKWSLFSSNDTHNDLIIQPDTTTTTARFVVKSGTGNNDISFIANNTGNSSADVDIQVKLKVRGETDFFNTLDMNGQSINNVSSISGSGSNLSLNTKATDSNQLRERLTFENTKATFSNLSIIELNAPNVSIAGDLNMTGQQIRQVSRPTLGTDCANKVYVDEAIANIPNVEPSGNYLPLSGNIDNPMTGSIVFDADTIFTGREPHYSIGGGTTVGAMAYKVGDNGTHNFYNGEEDLLFIMGQNNNNISRFELDMTNNKIANLKPAENEYDAVTKLQLDDIKSGAIQYSIDTINTNTYQLIPNTSWNNLFILKQGKYLVTAMINGEIPNTGKLRLPIALNLRIKITNTDLEYNTYSYAPATALNGNAGVSAYINQELKYVIDVPQEGKTKTLYAELRIFTQDENVENVSIIYTCMPVQS